MKQEAVHFLAIYCSFGMSPIIIELYTMILMIIPIPIAIIYMLEYGKAIQQKRVSHAHGGNTGSQPVGILILVHQNFLSTPNTRTMVGRMMKYLDNSISG